MNFDKLPVNLINIGWGTQLRHHTSTPLVPWGPHPLVELLPVIFILHLPFSFCPPPETLNIEWVAITRPCCPHKSQGTGVRAIYSCYLDHPGFNTSFYPEFIFSLTFIVHVKQTYYYFWGHETLCVL